MRSPATAVAKLEQLKEGHQEVESRLHYTETVIKEKRIFYHRYLRVLL